MRHILYEVLRKPDHVPVFGVLDSEEQASSGLDMCWVNSV